MLLSESPGTIALPTSEVGRFALFTVALAGTQQPDGWYLDASCSASVTENLNGVFRRLRDEDAAVWVMGDDHTWPGTALMDMLQTMDENPEIDVLVPLCVKRNPPWHLVIFDELGTKDEDGTPLLRPIPWERVPESGVFEIDAAGSAGMLIRREVIDTLGDPFWYSTMDAEGRQVVLNEDVTACKRMREHGFRIFATADVQIGHLGIFNVRPLHHDGRWGALTEFSTMEDKFRHVFMPVEETNRYPALEPRHREIIRRRNRGESLTGIGREMELTRERARQLEAEAFEIIEAAMDGMEETAGV